MGKSKKKKRPSRAQRKAATEAKAEREREEAERRRAEDEQRADDAISAGMKVLGITDDEADLFVKIPPTDDCAVCWVALPVDEEYRAYWVCCGNDICMSCADRSHEAQAQSNAERATKGHPPLPLSCPFCRASADITQDEYLERYEKRFALRDAAAMIELTGSYQTGTEFVGKDERKAFELTLRAVELGNPKAFNSLASFYDLETVVRFDDAKVIVCLKAAARGGYYLAHFNLGLVAYYDDGNIELALQHFQFAASTGYKPAIDEIQQMHEKGKISDAEFTAALRDYQGAFIAQRSDERVEWAEKEKKEKAMSKHLSSIDHF